MRDLGTRYLMRARSLRRTLTKAEVLVWARLRRVPDIRFRRQHTIGPYIADFACFKFKLVVEIDGATHSTDTEVAHDTERERHMRERGWRVLRLQNQDVFDHLDDVIETILRECQKAPSGR
jgi:very-short-patch-repair endonuclease